MKKLQILTFAGLAAVAAHGAVMDGLAAKVDNECIMIGDVLAEVRRNPAAREQFAAAANDKAKLAALYQNAIDTLIDRKLILKAAAEKKMDMQEWVIDNRVREIVKAHDSAFPGAALPVVCRFRRDRPAWFELHALQRRYSCVA